MIRIKTHSKVHRVLVLLITTVGHVHKETMMNKQDKAVKGINKVSFLYLR